MTLLSKNEYSICPDDNILGKPQKSYFYGPATKSGGDGKGRATKKKFNIQQIPLVQIKTVAGASDKK